MFRDVMSETDQEHLLTNIINHASNGSGLERTGIVASSCFLRFKDLRSTRNFAHVRRATSPL